MTVDLTFRGRRVMRDRALVMAIINRTPDSFYDQGATVEGRWGILRGWASMQNGNDDAGNDYAFTGRGMIDVLGGM